MSEKTMEFWDILLHFSKRNPQWRVEETEALPVLLTKEGDLIEVDGTASLTLGGTWFTRECYDYLADLPKILDEFNVLRNIFYEDDAIRVGKKDRRTGLVKSILINQVEFDRIF